MARNPSRAPRRLAVGLAALLALGAGCLTDEDGKPGAPGEDPDAVEQMDQDPRQERVVASQADDVSAAKRAAADS